MQYDCVYEANPLLPKIPTVSEMLFLKTIVLLPSYKAINEAITITDEDLIPPILLTSYVVYNNLEVTDRAKTRCGRR